MASLGLIIYVAGLLSLVGLRKHMLVVLLSLELMMLGVFMLLFSLGQSYFVEVIIFYLVLVVCEASLGLGILVMNVYFYGSDHAQSISGLSC